MSAFSIASILGIPVGLELASRYSWQAPFYSLSLLCLVSTLLVMLYVPVKTQLNKPVNHPFSRLLNQRIFWQGYLMIASVMFLGFMFIPNIATYVVFNLGFPEQQLGRLYLVGGVVSFFVLLLAGKLGELMNFGWLVGLGQLLLLIQPLIIYQLKSNRASFEAIS